MNCRPHSLHFRTENANPSETKRTFKTEKRIIGGKKDDQEETEERSAPVHQQAMYLLYIYIDTD